MALAQFHSGPRGLARVQAQNVPVGVMDHRNQVDPVFGQMALDGRKRAVARFPEFLVQVGRLVLVPAACDP